MRPRQECVLHDECGHHQGFSLIRFNGLAPLLLTGAVSAVIPINRALYLARHSSHISQSCR
jgi:hypothetical protein